MKAQNSGSRSLEAQNSGSLRPFGITELLFFAPFGNSELWIPGPLKAQDPAPSLPKRQSFASLLWRKHGNWPLPDHHEDSQRPYKALKDSQGPYKILRDSYGLCSIRQLKFLRGLIRPLKTFRGLIKTLTILEGPFKALTDS